MGSHSASGRRSSPAPRCRIGAPRSAGSPSTRSRGERRGGPTPGGDIYFLMQRRLCYRLESGTLRLIVARVAGLPRKVHSDTGAALPPDDFT